MIDLEQAKAFAIENGGIDAVVKDRDYNGEVLYKFIPFAGWKKKKIGVPIMFIKTDEGFSFLPRQEVLNWMLARARRKYR